MNVIIGLLGLLAAALAIASLFTTKTAFFLKNKTKKKAVLSWLGIAFVFMVISGALAPQKDPAAAIREMAAKQQAADKAAGVVEPTPEERAAKTAAAQNELRAFFDELQAMRNDRRFYELGFSANNKAASEWKTRVEAWRERISNDGALPGEVRAAPGTLLMLGLEWQRNKGEMTDMAKWHADALRTALGWKPEQ